MCQLIGSCSPFSLLPVEKLPPPGTLPRFRWRWLGRVFLRRLQQGDLPLGILQSGLEKANLAGQLLVPAHDRRILVLQPFQLVAVLLT